MDLDPYGIDQYSISGINDLNINSNNSKSNNSGSNSNINVDKGYSNISSSSNSNYTSDSYNANDIVYTSTSSVSSYNSTSNNSNSGSSSYNPNAVVYSSNSSQSSGREIYSVEGESPNFASEAEQENSWGDLFVNGLKSIENSYLSKEITNWNESFQDILDLPDTECKLQKLATIANDFVYAADTFGKIIISEVYTPDHCKTIKPLDIGGVAGGEKFNIQNIIFKFAKDTEIREGTFMYGGDKRADGSAMKSANHEIKGLNHFMEISNGGLIRFPLMAIIDYRGYRLLAISQLPIDKTTIVYGSCDGGKVVHNSDPLVAQEMERIAKLLNLRGHTVGLTQTFIYGPGDIEVHKGRDGRYYMVDFARIFPPEYPLIFQNHKEKIGREIFYQMLRPELVIRSEVPLSSDAFSGWQTSLFESDLNRDIIRATRVLHSEIVEMAVTALNVKDEIDYSPPTHKIHEILKLVNILNSQGINNRYLGYICSQLKVRCIKELLLSDVVSRVWKRIIRSKLRKIMDLTRRPSEAPYKLLISDVFRLIIKSDAPQVEFWSSMSPGSFKHIALQVFPRCLSESDMNPEFDLRLILDVRVIILRLIKMLNIRVHDGSLSQFLDTSDTAFYVLGQQDILEVGSTVKYPYIIDYASGCDLLYQTQKIIKTPKINFCPLEVDRWISNSKTKLYDAVRQMPSSFDVLIKLLTAFHIKASVTVEHKTAIQVLVIGIIMGSWNISFEQQKSPTLKGILGLFHLNLAAIYLFNSHFVDHFEKEIELAREYLEYALEKDPNCLDNYMFQCLPITFSSRPYELDKFSEQYQIKKVYQLMTLTYIRLKLPETSPINQYLQKYFDNIIQVDNFEVLETAGTIMNCKVVTKIFDSFKLLQSLSIRKLTFSQDISDSLSQLTKLTSLGIYDVTPHEKDKNFGQFFEMIFTNCKDLQKLKLISNSYINDETFDNCLEHFTNLNELVINNIKLLTGKTLPKIKPFSSNLKSLTISNSNEFNDTDICTFLESTSELKQLNLNDLPRLSDYTINFIIQSQFSLKHLSLISSGFTKGALMEVIKQLELKTFSKPEFEFAHTYQIRAPPSK